MLCFFRPLLKQIKNSAESHIVLDCSTERIYDVLKQAQQIGMMSDYHSYLITSLVTIKMRVNLIFIYSFLKDLHGVDLEEFKYGGTNITALRLVDPDGPEVRKSVRDWNASEGRNKKSEITALVSENFVTCFHSNYVHCFVYENSCKLTGYQCLLGFC